MYINIKIYILFQMKILPEITNFKINQNLEKLLLISALSMLPTQLNSNPNLDTYNTSNTQIQNPINSFNSFQINPNYKIVSQTLGYDLSQQEIDLEKIKSQIRYNI
jgi:hypothetical protein